MQRCGAMRVAICLILAFLAACETDDECESSFDVHASSTDMALDEYVDADTYSSTLLMQPYTAVGGTQRFVVESEDCEHLGPVHDVTATTEDPAVVTATTHGSTLEVRGVAPGIGTVDLKSGTEPGWASFGVVAIDHVALAAREFGEPGAFYAGGPVAMILLCDVDTQPAVDDSLTVSGAIPLGDKWNHLAIAGAGPGVYPLTIHAGGADWPVTATVVDSITDIAPRDGIVTALPGGTTEVCFLAHDNGVVVAGVPWKIDIDGHAPTKVDPRANCVLVSASSGVKTVTAHALGFTAAATVSFGISESHR